MKKTSQRQILTLREMAKYADPDTAKQWIKPVSSSGAQTVKLLSGRSNYERVINLVNSLISDESKEPVLHRAVIELMYLHGMRISEICNIRGTDINRTGHIHITGSKGSQNRYVAPGRYFEFWKGMRGNTQRLGDTYSRYYWYRLFRRLGLSISIDKSTRQAVTHSLRHIYINEAIRGEEDVATIKNSIGHRTEKSTRYYNEKNEDQKRKGYQNNDKVRRKR